MVLIGYLLMHITFVNLWLKARKISTSAWVAPLILMSSTTALLLALAFAHLVGIPVDPVGLSEALPFLVVTVGFDKPMRLATFMLSRRRDASDATAIERVASPILRDYMLEIGILSLGALSKIPGLRELCALAAMILICDAFAMLTFFVAVMRLVMIDNAPKPLHIDTGRAVAGKGVASTNVAVVDRKSSLARLKVLLIGAFVTLHALNLVTTLTPAAALSRSKRSNRPELARKVDISTPTISRALDAIGGSRNSGAGDILVRISPPVTLRAIPPFVWIQTAAAATATPEAMADEHAAEPTPGASDMSTAALFKLAEQPTFGKWLILALGASVFLNGYLLRSQPEERRSSRSRVPRSAMLTPGGTVKAPADQSYFGSHAVSRAPSPKPEASGFANGRLAQNGDAKAAAGDSPMPAAGEDQKIVPEILAPTPIAAAINALALAQRTANSSGVHTAATSPIGSNASESEDEDAKRMGSTDEVRPLEECVRIFEAGPDWNERLNDEEIILLGQTGKIPAYALEKVLGDYERAVVIRRALICAALVFRAAMA